MNAMRPLLALSVILNLVLAGMLWRMTWVRNAAQRLPQVSAAKAVPSSAADASTTSVEPQFNAEHLPKIWNTDRVAPLPGDQAAGGQTPFVRAPLRRVPDRGETTPPPAVKEMLNRLKQARLEAEELGSGEFTRPNSMYQIPPRLHLTPGRSMSISTPHWDENPVLRHGEN